MRGTSASGFLSHSTMDPFLQRDTRGQISTGCLAESGGMTRGWNMIERILRSSAGGTMSIGFTSRIVVASMRQTCSFNLKTRGKGPETPV